MGNGLFTPTDVNNLEKGAIQSRSYIWNTGTLAWEAATGSLTGGGTVTVNNFPATQAISAASLPLPSGAALDASILAELASYKITDDDSIPNPSYFGYTNSAGNWYIMKIDTVASSYRYVKGDSAYTTNWTNRAALGYDYFYTIF